MKRGFSFRFFSLAMLFSLALSSCSITKFLQDDEYTLVENKIVIEEGKKYKTSELKSYIKQNANTYHIGKWNPFLYVYNWKDGKGGGWDRFCEKLGKKPVVFDPTRVEESCRSIESHLEYVGYYGSKVSSEVVKKDKKATVIYSVNLGRQFSIDTVECHVSDTLMKRLLDADSSNYTIHPGDFLSESSVEKEAERMASLFRDNGYYGFTKNYFFFYADTNGRDGKATLIYKLRNYTVNETPESAKEHRQYHFGRISVVPQNGLKVNADFLRDLNKIQPGDLYRESTVNNTYERYSSVNIINTVNMTLAEEDSTHVSCDIYLSPGKLQGLKFKLDGSVNSTGLFGITPSISYSNKNIFRGGELFSIGFMGNFQFQPKSSVRSNEFAVTTSILFPKFLMIPTSSFKSKLPNTEIKATVNYQYRPEYTRAMISAQYGYRWSLSKNVSFQMNPAVASVTRMLYLDEEFIKSIKDPYLKNSYKNHIDIGGSAGIFYTTDPAMMPKHTYFYTRSQTDVAGNLLYLFRSLMKKNAYDEAMIWGVPFSQYVRQEITAVETIRFGSEDQFALALRGLGGIGVAYGNSTSLPFEKYFYAGGASSMRGWQSRTLGPGAAPMDTSFSIPNQSGDMRLEMNAEFRFPIVWKLNGALFVDAGNIWTLFRHYDIDLDRDYQGCFYFDNFLKTSALDWGLGARLDFGIILVRFDAGFKLYDPRRQSWCTPENWFSKDGYALHFGIGYPF